MKESVSDLCGRCVTEPVLFFTATGSFQGQLLETLCCCLNTHLTCICLVGYAVNHITEPSVALSFHQEKISCFEEFLVRTIHSLFSVV